MVFLKGRVPHGTPSRPSPPELRSENRLDFPWRKPSQLPMEVHLSRSIGSLAYFCGVSEAKTSNVCLWHEHRTWPVRIFSQKWQKKCPVTWWRPVSGRTASEGIASIAIARKDGLDDRTTAEPPPRPPYNRTRHSSAARLGRLRAEKGLL